MTSPPQSYLGTARHYPHVGKCTLPLHVLAVEYTMHNEALQKHYRALQNVTEALRIVTKHYRMLQSNAGRYGTFRSIAEVLKGVPVLRKLYRTLWSTEGSYGTLRKCCGAVTEGYGTVIENIDFVLH